MFAREIFNFVGLAVSDFSTVGGFVLSIHLASQANAKTLGSVGQISHNFRDRKLFPWVCRLGNVSPSGLPNVHGLYYSSQNEKRP
jgi:hypothetical protein